MSTPETETITLKTVDTPQRLLVAFAHPDDESFGPAGTLIHYAQNNTAVHYVCGTRGEAGEVDPDLLKDYDSLGALRTQELLNAADHLGLSSIHFLNYRDSGMEGSADNDNPASLTQAPLEEVTEKIVALIRQIQPQVVITFDPQGGYFHPDHIKMHQATTAAFAAAGDASQFSHQLEAGLQPYQPQKLYYTAFSRGFIKVVVMLLPLFRQDPKAFGKNKDIDLKRIADIEQTVTTKLRVSPHYQLARKAAECHASQSSGGPGILPNLLQKWLRRFDTYTRIVPEFKRGEAIESNLFLGVEG